MTGPAAPGTVADLVGAALAGLGVGHAFGVAGSGNFHVTNALRAAGVPFVAARHEGGAATMADAWARTTGRPAVLTLHQGCGLTNATTGIAEAAKSRTPLLVLAAYTGAAAVRSNFRIDRTRWSRRWAQWPSGCTRPRRQPRGARVFVAGRGARGAGPQLRSLAAASGALLATPAVAHGLFAGADWSLGISGGFASPLAAELIRDADLLVGWGGALTGWTTRHGRLVGPAARVVQVDLDADAVGAHQPVDLGVLGDVAATAADLLPAVEPRTGYRTDAVRAAAGARPDRVGRRVVVARRGLPGALRPVPGAAATRLSRDGGRARRQTPASVRPQRYHGRWCSGRGGAAASKQEAALLTDVTPAPVRSRMAVPDTALLALLGSRDESLRATEELLDADVHVRGNELTLTGAPGEVAFAERVFAELIALAQRGQHVGTDTVRRTVEMLSDGDSSAGLGESPAEVLSLDILSRRGKTIRPKTLNQKRYVDAIDANTIVFGIGPAGTGKTYLAMAKAVQALQAKQVNRIILTRPAVEAGERLGYLPGTLFDKIDPYLRPLYDALHDMIDPESIPKLIAAGTIEVAPLAYMRGRSLNDAFIILDEAQNTTPEQMKMFLTRLGFGSKIVVTGDVTQIDLPGGTRSGLQVVRDILDGLDDVHFAVLTSTDVVRHRLVSDIVDAYARFDAASGRQTLASASSTASSTAPRTGPPQDRRSRRR